ncbi:NAC domain-containing protein 68-like [Prunus dulcis]|uniref:NAC domain-containing protein 68-like n=1 Tax=Prunus dulcis TaxID=3755 RepID=UPI001482BB1E|nr:NAC domain-containing protein 68-like [Prunus dulcis]
MEGEISSSSSTTIDAWVLDLLRGFRYHPSEEEMVNLLKKQVEGQGSQAMPEIEDKPWDLPDNESIQLVLRFSERMMQGKASQARHIIPDIDFYKYEPWELAGLMLPDSPYQTRMWLCFSRPDHKYANSPRCNRLTEKGFWKITGKPREIKSRQLSKSVTCKKRTLTFHLGRPSKSSKTGWVKQEYSLTSTVPGSNLSGLVLLRMKNKSADYESDNKQQQDVSIYDESADPAIGGDMASNSQDDQAAANHMIPEAEEHLLGSGNHNDGDPGGFVSSDFAIIQELCAQLGLDSPSPPPEQPRSHQLPQLGNVPGTGDYLASNSDNQAAAIHHMTTDEEELLAYKELERVLLGSGNPDDGEPGSCVSSDKLQELCAQPGEDLDSPVPPPGHPELRNAPDVYTDKCSIRSSPIRDNDSSLANKNNIPTNYDSKPVSNTVSNFENQNTYRRSSEVYCQSEENLQSFYRSLELEDYAFSSPIPHLDLGDILHTNNYIGCNANNFIGCNESQPAALFPQSS